MFAAFLKWLFPAKVVDEIKEEIASSPRPRDLCPEYPLGAVVVLPQPNGEWALYRKRLVRPLSCESSVLGLGRELDETFSSPEEALARWRHTPKPPVVVLEGEQ